MREEPLPKGLGLEEVEQLLATKGKWNWNGERQCKEEDAMEEGRQADPLLRRHSGGEKTEPPWRERVERWRNKEQNQGGGRPRQVRYGGGTMAGGGE